MNEVGRIEESWRLRGSWSSGRFELAQGFCPIGKWWGKVKQTPRKCKGKRSVALFDHYVLSMYIYIYIYIYIIVTYIYIYILYQGMHMYPERYHMSIIDYSIQFWPSVHPCPPLVFFVHISNSKWYTQYSCNTWDTWQRNWVSCVFQRFTMPMSVKSLNWNVHSL